LEYAIVVNPAAGRMGRADSRDRLDLIARKLRAPILGRDTTSVQDFRACVAQASQNCRVLLVAGGDGTFAEVINSLSGDPILGFLPFGAGNALGYALGSIRSTAGYLAKVVRGEYSRVSVILVNETRKSLLASLGVDALALHKCTRLTLFPHHGFLQYTLALAAAMDSFAPADLDIRVDGLDWRLADNLMTIISKHPYYGYGFLVNPQASLTEPSLSLRTINSPRLVTSALLEAVARKRPGTDSIHQGKRIDIACSTEQWLQCDGECMGPGKEFSFRVLPDELKLIM